ncbi:MAG: hypothetical protein M1833_000087 [Piccolia ochrophora]|nr:MAG: hypothetical protein M1833_000087 [Piccolia ochrophora]
MRTSRICLGAVAVLLIQCGRANNDERLLAPRQADQTPPSSEPALPAPTPSPPGEAVTTGDAAAKTAEPSESSPSTSQAPESAAASSASSASASNSATESGFPSSTLPDPSASPTDMEQALPSTSEGAINTDANALPLPPRITPGLSVAGVIMLLSGILYTLVGIKEKRLHIALSTAYLTSLAVCVLIIYVMNPPISNAIQGAYVVAAVFTGLIFGALSLVFTEVTEGLGCLLGGFCLSMWFMVLKPGGLVTSNVGKAILIPTFTVVAYALSFSQYTRTYGLIVSTSFAGATVIVLAIDCFSRAGLKEFWVYIWGLNGKIFPLNTNTYPHTRGIRVEIACIILIFLLGIISQFKLWKVIKDRRERKETARKQEEQDLDQEETSVGRRIEQENGRERAEWEAVYGDREAKIQNTADSGLGDELDSTRKSSASAGEAKDWAQRTTETLELTDMTNSPRTSRGPVSNRNSGEQRVPTVTIRVAHDEETLPRIGEDGKPIAPTENINSIRDVVRLSGANKSAEPIDRTSANVGQEQSVEGSKNNPARSSVRPAPEIVPLPFSVPFETESEHQDDHSSVATFAESDHAPVVPTKRLSAASAIKRLSRGTPRTSRAFSESSEALVVPHIDNDQESSLAATVDDLTDDQDSLLTGSRATPLPFPEDTETDNSWGLNKTNENTSWKPRNQRPESENRNISGPALVENEIGEGTNMAGLPRSRGSKALSSSDVNPDSFPEPPTATTVAKDRSPESHQASLTMSTNPNRKSESQRESFSAEKRNSRSSQNFKPDDAAKIKPSKSLKSLRSRPASQISGRESITSLAGQLPEHLSKVVMSYRTNEWAKHLDAADKPELDTITLPQYTDTVDAGQKESVAPVDVEELQKTTESTQPPFALNSPSRTSTPGSLHFPLGRSASNLSRSSLPDPHPQGPNRASSTKGFYQQGGVHRSSSQLSHHGGSPTPIAMHSSSSLPTQPLSVMTRGFRSSSTPVLNQPLLESPAEDSPYIASNSRFTPSPIPSSTLMGQRDSLLRNKYPSFSTSNLASTADLSTQISPNDSASVYGSRLSVLDEDDVPLTERKGLIQQQRPTTSQTHLFNSHQPARSSSTVDAQKRENMLAQWRQSIQEDLALSQQPKVATEARRAEMLLERQQKQQSQRQQAVATTFRDGLIDERMRRGDMHDLHKEAMRRMQANANKHV